MSAAIPQSVTQSNRCFIESDSPARWYAMMIGAVGIVSAVAMQILGTGSLTTSLIVGTMSVSVLLGGVTGILPLIVLPLIVAMGFILAQPVPPYAYVDYYPIVY